MAIVVVSVIVSEELLKGKSWAWGGGGEEAGQESVRVVRVVCNVKLCIVVGHLLACGPHQSAFTGCGVGSNNTMRKASCCSCPWLLWFGSNRGPRVWLMVAGKLW